MKNYIVEFTYLDGNKEEVEFITDKIDWTIAQYRRNRMIAKSEVINESNTNSKKMLLG
tara:strand:+ start:36 stop:209 length:174 start_codon:yes stop_codon:yes gene_type:complete